MSRLSRFLRSLPCRWMGGHQWYDSPFKPYPTPDGWTRKIVCLRCHQSVPWSESLSRQSSSSFEIEGASVYMARPLGTAVTVHGVPHRITRVSTQRYGEGYSRTEVIEPESAIRGGASR